MSLPWDAAAYVVFGLQPELNLIAVSRIKSQFKLGYVSNPLIIKKFMKTKGTTGSA